MRAAQPFFPLGQRGNKAGDGSITIVLLQDVPPVMREQLVPLR